MQPTIRAFVLALLIFVCGQTGNKALAQQCSADASFKDPVYSNFNFCTTTSNVSSFEFIIENASTTKSSNLSYTINWGDDSGEVTVGKDFTTASHIYKAAGSYDIVVTATGANGCRSSKTEKLFIGSNPGLGITSSGNNTDCAPASFEFKISGVEGNSPQTVYTFQFDDGSPAIKYTHANLPADRIIRHTFTESSQKKPNGFTLTGKAENRCNTSLATFTGIRISKGPIADIEASLSGCIGQVIKLQDTSQSGYDASSNSERHKRRWSVTPATGWELVAGTLESASPNVRFNASGVYTIKIDVSPLDPNSSCAPSSKEQTITIGELPEVTITSGKPIICLGESTTLEASGTDSYTWLPAEGLTMTTGDKVIVKPTKTTTYTVTGNNGTGCSVTTTFTVQVNPLAPAPQAEETVTCYGSQTTLKIKNAEGDINWYYDQNGITPFHTGPVYQTPALYQDVTYYVTQSINGGCPSQRQAVKVIVRPEITAPVVHSVTLCGKGNTATLTASGNATTYLWYDSPEKTRLLHTGKTFKTEPLTESKTYYIQASTGNCLSPLAEAQVTVLETYINNITQNNLEAPQYPICYGQKPSEIIGSTPSGGEHPFTYRWEKSETGPENDFHVISDATTSSYQPSELRHTTWFRRIAISGPCAENVSKAIRVEVLPAISHKIITSAQVICEGGLPHPLKGSMPEGGSGEKSYTYLWESSITGPETGFSPAAGNNTQLDYTAPSPLRTATWYRRVVNSTPCLKDVSTAVLITVQPAITKNTISTGNPIICAGDIPSLLEGSTPAGGNGTYTYIWESSTTGRAEDFEIIEKGNNKDLTPIHTLEQDTWFRRKAISGECISVSESIKVTVNSAITRNIISKDQAICTGMIPSPLTGEIPNGGNGLYSYQWEISVTGKEESFKAILHSTKVDYQPGALTADTWYRRIVRSGACVQASNLVKITVSPVITNNTVALPQSIYAGQTPSPLTGSYPAGGAGTESYTYVWESSTTGQAQGFAAASGTNNSKNYSPGMLHESTWIRRRVLSGGCESVSAPVLIHVISAISNNNIESDQVICYNNRPTPLKGTVPTGGNAEYLYLWQYSTKGPDKGFTSAPGISNGQHYNPLQLTQDTWFRRIAVSGPNPDTSAAVHIAIKPALNNNRISTSQRICYATVPAMLTGSAPTGGGGTYTYLWESSTDSPDKGFKTASGINNRPEYSPGELRETTWYRRIVSSESCGELISTAVEITVTPLPLAPVIHGITSVCTGTSTTLSATSGNDKLSVNKRFEWYTSPTGGVPLFVGTTFSTPALTQTTTYYVQEVSLSCASERRAVVVNVPAFIVSAGSDASILKGRSVTLHGSGNGTYSWSPATGLSDPASAGPLAKPQSTTTYTLTVTSASGCVTTAQVTITVMETITVPNTFTPNRDGINDTWEIPNITIYPACKVQVFNQWGSLVFQSEGYKQPWDGRHNGQELPLATYYYIIHFDQNEKPLTGSVTIVK